MVETPWFHLAAGAHTTVGIRPFVLGGQLRIGVIVKLSLELPHPIARVVAPPPIARDDRYAATRGVGSVIEASEIALRKPACDVTMTGVARTPGGQPAQTLPVRLTIFRGNTPILRKAVIANGPARANGDLEPITAMPLTYERAFGGPEVLANPIGSGSPSVHMADGNSRPGCFAPLPAAWAMRRQRLEASVRQELGTAVPAISEPFDWSYFQSAPPDQILSHLAGGEWVLIDGISSRWPRIQTQLPMLEARAFLVTRTTQQSIPLSWDTLAIEGESLRASALFRGDVPSPVPLTETRDLAVVVRIGGGDVLGPHDVNDIFAESNLVSALTRDASIALDATKGLSGADHQSASRKPIAPYVIGERGEGGPAIAEAPTPGAPWSGTPVTRVTPATSRNVTLPLSAEDLRAPNAAPVMAPPVMVPPVMAPPVMAPPVMAPSVMAPPVMAPRQPPVVEALGEAPGVVASEQVALGMPTFLLGQAPPRAMRESASVPSSAQAGPIAPPARIGAPETVSRRDVQTKQPSRLELAATALRKSGMSEDRLAEVLRELQRDIGTE